jgi:hypothetical protein
MALARQAPAQAKANIAGANNQYVHEINYSESRYTILAGNAVSGTSKIAAPAGAGAM